jgi:hypothetical protein
VRDAPGAGLRQQPRRRHVQQGRGLARIEQRRYGLLADQCGELRRESTGVGAFSLDARCYTPNKPNKLDPMLWWCIPNRCPPGSRALLATVLALEQSGTPDDLLDRPWGELFRCAGGLTPTVPLCSESEWEVLLRRAWRVERLSPALALGKSLQNYGTWRLGPQYLHKSLGCVAGFPRRFDVLS